MPALEIGSVNVKRRAATPLALVAPLALASCSVEDDRTPAERSPRSQAFGAGYVTGQFIAYTLLAFVVGLVIWRARRSTRSPSSRPSVTAPAPSVRLVPRGVERSPEAEAARIAPIVSKILANLGASLRPGLRTRDIEGRATALLREAELDPRMLGFRGFPSAVSVSIDDEVVHGIPSDRRIEEGQLVKIQIGGRTQRGSADQGWTFAIEGSRGVSEEKRRLRAAGIAALEKGLAVLRTGARTGDLGSAIQGTLEAAGFAAVRDFVGYGIGERPIQDPQLPCYGVRGQGLRLRAGMILHVHVLTVAGSHELAVKADRWTAVTQDGRPGALFTAVVRIRADGCDRLTDFLT